MQLGLRVLGPVQLGVGPVPGDLGTADAVAEPIDRNLLAKLAGVVESATEAFEGYDQSRAYERVETFWRSFCDGLPGSGQDARLRRR